MSRWLLAGSYGMLGQNRMAALGTVSGGQEVTGIYRDSVDITDPDAGLAAVTGHDIMVNPASWTASRVFPTTSDSSVRLAPRPTHALEHDPWQCAGVAPVSAWRETLTRAAVDVAGMPV